MERGRPTAGEPAGLTPALYFQLRRMEESQQEATEKEVERILGLLQTYFREDRKYRVGQGGAVSASPRHLAGSLRAKALSLSAVPRAPWFFRPVCLTRLLPRGENVGELTVLSYF